MMSWILDSFMILMSRGGIVMWLLLVLSIIDVALIFERICFFLKTNRSSRLHVMSEMARLLRLGQLDKARQLADADDSIYGDVVLDLIKEPPTESTVMGIVEFHRHRLERFMPVLSTVITAAPMLGILGTVLGIIYSFEILSEQVNGTDPRSVSQGIAQALITTAAGLVIAVVTLFPYNTFRWQVDRTLSRLEVLAAAIMGK